MWLGLDGKDALYLQVYRALRQAILEGRLPPGDRLPATRALARELGLSRNVVLLAYDQLYAEGYVEGRVGAGTFVAPELPETLLEAPRPPSHASTPAAPRFSEFGKRALALDPAARRRGTPPPEAHLVYDFQYGELAPDGRILNQWRRLLGRLAVDLDLNYAPAAGRPRLRKELAEYVRRNRGITCEPDQVVVVNGSQQALTLATRLLLDPGDRVLIEDPHYQGARQIFLAAGAELVRGPVDSEGLCLEDAPVEAETARLAYVTPSHQFPSGAVLPLARRLELLEWADRADAYIVEDDYDSEYRYEGRPVEAVYGLDQRGRTLYVGTLSKVLFPALRLGFMVLPEPLVQPFTAAKWLADRQSPSLEQEVLAQLIADGHFESHLRRMRSQNSRRRQALLEALDRDLGSGVEITGTNAGVHLLVWLNDLAPERTDELVVRAAEEGIGLYSIAPYFLEAPPRAGLLMGYASLEPDEIQQGVARLGRVLGELTRRVSR